LSNKVKKKRKKWKLFSEKQHPLKDKLILFLVFLSLERNIYSK